MTRLRVAIDLRLVGYRPGGIARYASDLYTALGRVPDVSVWAVRSRADTTPDSHARRFRTPPHHRFERYSIATEMVLARERPDVYHATDFIAPRIPGVTRVATVHDLSFMRRPGDLQDDALAYYRQLQQARSWTHSWITPSQWTADELTELFDVDPAAITVIPHGISIDLDREEIVPRAERSGYILAVGTIEPRKRYDLLVDTLKLLPDPPVLEVVGRRGWNSAAIERRLVSTTGINWRRAEKDASLRNLYQNALAVVIPSHTEGFGLVALEAMAAGTPVISSGNGALPEVTGLAAFVPAGDDAASWAAAIRRVQNDEALWNELSAFGRRRAQEFSWSRAARETAEVYRQATAR